METVFPSSPTSQIVEDTPTKLLLHDKNGRALLDPDARSVVTTFPFDAASKLAEVKAPHLKNR